jgi:calcium-dependent protein kinase
MSKLDKDKSGRIDLNEFTSAMIDRQSLFVKDSLLEAFDYFDSDKTGFIERKELEVLMQGCEIK